MGFPTLIFSVPMFNPVLFSLLGRYTRKTFLSDLVSGAIVGIVALPLAIAFAIASGVPPEVGLITAVGDPRGSKGQDYPDAPGPIH